MTTTDLILLYSACLLVVAGALVASLAFVEDRRPPLKERLDEIVRAAAGKKKGPCP